jgi:hypothetical protein
VVGPRYLEFAHQRQKLKSFVESYVANLDRHSNEVAKHLIGYLVDPFLQIEKERFLDYFAVSLCKPFMGNFRVFSGVDLSLEKFSTWEECRSEVWKIQVEIVNKSVTIQDAISQIFETLCEKMRDKVVEWIHQFCATFQLEDLLGVEKARETVKYLCNFVQKNFVEMFQFNCQHLVVSCLQLKLQQL